MESTVLILSIILPIFSNIVYFKMAKSYPSCGNLNSLLDVYT